MIMQSGNVSVRVPSYIPQVEIPELQRKIEQFVLILYPRPKTEQKDVVGESATKSVLPLKGLDEGIRQLCGVINVDEDDLDGDRARAERLEGMLL
ncbi:MAG: hypothetical protein II970_04080 [Paludibacteraceae bacterium]|nr:hypothetical protein [Paludibacteraceae bacterium]